MELVVRGHDFFPMGPHTFMWVQVVHFELPATMDDRQAIAAMVSSPGFNHDYASPYSPTPLTAVGSVHGRWWLDAVTPDLFQPHSADAAETTLRQWATVQDWSDPNYVPPPDAMARLAQAIALFQLGAIYTLHHPGGEWMHVYGGVTGEMGFHEFVVMDRARGMLHEIVASDD